MSWNREVSMDKSRVSTKLDWNRMLGFEQITEERDSIRDEAARALGPKVGRKVGEKTGLKLGAKLGGKVGNKEGIKTRT
jgi:hypothetical protein